jgi:pilus assembly protein CpaE
MMMSVQADMAYLKGAMRAGAREFLIKPFGYDELINAIRRVYSADPSPAELAAIAAAAGAGQEKGGIPKIERAIMVAVYAPKGGVGCSTIAANLAIALGGSREADVLLVDADLYFGDLDAMLDLHPKHNMVDVLKAFDPEDQELLRRMLVEHPSGIRLLAGPGRPELAELVHPDHFHALVDTIKQMHDYVVFDLGCRYNEFTRRVLDAVDRVILVVTPEVTTVKNVNMFLKMSGPRSFPLGKVVPLLNKYHSMWGITPQTVTDTIGQTVALAIPADEGAARSSVNRGRPVLLSAPRSQMVRPLLDLEKLIPDHEKLADELAELARQREGVPPPPIAGQEPRGEEAIESPGDEEFKVQEEERGCARWIPFLGRR